MEEEQPAVQTYASSSTQAPVENFKQGMLVHLVYEDGQFIAVPRKKKQEFLVCRVCTKEVSGHSHLKFGECKHKLHIRCADKTDLKHAETRIGSLKCPKCIVDDHARFDLSLGRFRANFLDRDTKVSEQDQVLCLRRFGFFEPEKYASITSRTSMASISTLLMSKTAAPAMPTTGHWRNAEVVSKKDVEMLKELKKKLTPADYPGIPCVQLLEANLDIQWIHNTFNFRSFEEFVHSTNFTPTCFAHVSTAPFLVYKYSIDVWKVIEVLGLENVTAKQFSRCTLDVFKLLKIDAYVLMLIGLRKDMLAIFRFITENAWMQQMGLDREALQIMRVTSDDFGHNQILDRYAQLERLFRVQ